MYPGCCITKGESTMLLFMWHHTWMTSFDCVLHCSSSWCHLSRQLVSTNAVCIARCWAITISSRGCGNIAPLSLWPALGFSSYHHMTIRSVLRTKTVFIPMLLRRRRSNDLHAGFFFFLWEFRTDNYRSCCYACTQGKQCLCSLRSSFLYEVVIPTQAW